MTSYELDAWFAAAPDSQRALLEELRATILAAAPGIAEEKKWSRPCYSIGDTRFCYLERAKKHVTLGFTHGTSLADPGNLLGGTGKGMRHVKITPDFDRPAVLSLIQQAIQLTVDLRPADEAPA